VGEGKLKQDIERNACNILLILVQEDQLCKPFKEAGVQMNGLAFLESS
jgi:hypothetical protein